MPLVVSEEWVRDYCKRTGQKVPAELEKNAVPRSKYGNEKVTMDGETLDSKHEARIYNDLRLRCRSGEFKGLARQAAFYLPGGVKYMADFVTLNADGSYTVYDAKSEATRRNKVYRLKRRQMRECLGLEIEEV